MDTELDNIITFIFLVIYKEDRFSFYDLSFICLSVWSLPYLSVQTAVWSLSHSLLSVCLIFHLFFCLNSIPFVCLSDPRISTTEETFQSRIIDSTIFQTNSFDVLNLHCLFPVPHVQLILLRCWAKQKRHSNKKLKIFVSFK